MTWVYGWPLDQDYAIKLAKDLNLVRFPDPRESDYLFAGVQCIARKAEWEQIIECWVGQNLQIVFGAYVDHKHEASSPHPPMRYNLSRMMPFERWHKLEKCMPIDGNPRWYPAYNNSQTRSVWMGKIGLGEDDKIIGLADSVGHEAGSCEMGDDEVDTSLETTMERIGRDSRLMFMRGCSRDEMGSSLAWAVSAVMAAYAAAPRQGGDELADGLTLQFDAQCAI